MRTVIVRLIMIINEIDISNNNVDGGNTNSDHSKEDDRGQSQNYYRGRKYQIDEHGVDKLLFTKSIGVASAVDRPWDLMPNDTKYGKDLDSRPRD